MSASWVLGAVQIGTSLVSSIATASTMENIAESKNELIQLQIDRRVEQMTRQRRLYTTGLIGQQKAALAASGVVGGRTARLLEAQVRQQVSHAAQTSQINLNNRRESARYRQNVAQLGAKMSMFNSVVGAAASGVNLYQGYQERQRALNGPSGGSGRFMSDGYTINY